MLFGYIIKHTIYLLAINPSILNIGGSIDLVVMNQMPTKLTIIAPWARIDNTSFTIAFRALDANILAAKRIVVRIGPHCSCVKC